MESLCKICGIRPSKIHYTEIVNNKMVTMDLCLECAEEKGIDVQKAGSSGLGDLVAGLIDTTAQSDLDKIGKVHCPQCGYDYSQFKKIGRFGCPECYRAFEAQLMPLLRHVHGNTQHRGKAPKKLGVRAMLRRELMDLKEELNRAVQLEQYERAAELRDRIQELESEVREG